MTKATVPTQAELMNPTLQALHNLGGEATTKQIADEVARIMDLTAAQLAIVQRRPGKSDRSMLGINLAWVRTCLKKYGLLENPRYKFWIFTEAGRNTYRVDPTEVLRTVNQNHQQKKPPKPNPSSVPQDLSSSPLWRGKVLPAEEVVAGLLGWREQLAELLAGLSSAAFERLLRRILRESGINELDLSAHGDVLEGLGSMGGGFVSMRVCFRCVRSSRLVSTPEIEDFRRAVSLGRANKGLLMTTGSFTQEAEREAGRAMPEVDLIDGEQLMDKLKELSLGVETEPVVVEQVVVDSDWFAGI